MNSKNCVVSGTEKCARRPCQLANSTQQHNTWKDLFTSYQTDTNDIVNSNKHNHSLSQNGLNTIVVCLLYRSILTGDSLQTTTNNSTNNNELNFCYPNDSSQIDSSASSNILSDEEATLNHKNNSDIQKTEPRTVFGCNYRQRVEKNNKRLNVKDSFKLKIVAKEQAQLFILPYILFLLILLADQNAKTCLGFTSPLRHDSTGLTNHHLSHKPPTIAPNLNYRNMIRQITDDPLVILPSSQDSFSNDPTIQPQLGGWTSLLSGAFNGGHQEQDTLDHHIRNILIPRISGTEGNVEAREYIMAALKANNYHIELDEFTDPTPIGDVKFANIIASSNPNACRQLVLACHYDSKMMSGFLGATDSAVPCAMLLKISETFAKQFRPREDSEDQSNSLGLRFIFFDGEEAFLQWGPKDSLYGSRHLAEKWEKQAAPSQCEGKKNELSRIELFVLLDLIGTSDTSFVMYNMNLKRHYADMQRYEKAHLKKGGLTSNLQLRREAMFKGRYVPLDFVEDDHVPFKKRGVPILSLLAHPFPKVWHTVEDNYQAIDFPKTRRVLHVLEEFVANYRAENN